MAEIHVFIAEGEHAGALMKDERITYGAILPRNMRRIMVDVVNALMDLPDDATTPEEIGECITDGVREARAERDAESRADEPQYQREREALAADARMQRDAEER